MTLTEAQSALRSLLLKKSVMRGDFTLASGKKSTYYLDGKQITLHSAGLRLVCEGLLDLLEGVDYTAIGGMSIGGNGRSDRGLPSHHEFKYS